MGVADYITLFDCSCSVCLSGCSNINILSILGIGLFKMFSRWFFANSKLIITFRTSKFGRRNVECDDLISAATFGATRRRADVKKRPLLENVNKISLSFVLSNVYQSVVTHRMDHNPTYKYQVSLKL